MKKYKFIDLFCGCGGLSEGFVLAGFDCVGGVDFNQSAIDTYNYNFTKSNGVCCDLLEMSNDRILKEFGNLSDVDVIIGGPPCQGFSAANRYKHEGDDPRNKLFFEFVRFVEMANPKAILIENVRGIVTKDNGYAKDGFGERNHPQNQCAQVDDLSVIGEQFHHSGCKGKQQSAGDAHQHKFKDQQHACKIFHPLPVACT